MLLFGHLHQPPRLIARLNCMCLSSFLPYEGGLSLQRHSHILHTGLHPTAQFHAITMQPGVWRPIAICLTQGILLLVASVASWGGCRLSRLLRQISIVCLRLFPSLPSSPRLFPQLKIIPHSIWLIDWHFRVTERRRHGRSAIYHRERYCFVPSHKHHLQNLSDHRKLEKYPR